MPTIIADLGYASTKAQLLTVPPYAAAAVMTITIGYIADRTRQRGLCNIFCALLGMAGFSMLLGGQTAAVRYAGYVKRRIASIMVVDIASQNLSRRRGYLSLHSQYSLLGKQQP